MTAHIGKQRFGMQLRRLEPTRPSKLDRRRQRDETQRPVKTLAAQAELSQLGRL